jgi:hypothetical protein
MPGREAGPARPGAGRAVHSQGKPRSTVIRRVAASRVNEMSTSGKGGRHRRDQGCGAAGRLSDLHQGGIN